MRKIGNRVFMHRGKANVIDRSKGWAQAGFTLIEVIIVMAISTALGAMVLFGQGEVRKRAQFSDGVEKIKNSLVGVKNEANTTVNACSTPPCGSGGNDTSRIVVGKLVRFTDNSSQMQVSTLVGTCQTPSITDVCNAINPTLEERDVYHINVPWGVAFNEPPSEGHTIAFFRSPLNGELTVYTPPKGVNVLDSTFYRRDNALARRRVNLRFDDPNGYQASIFVNAAAAPGGGFDAGDGLITRSYD